MKRRMKGIHAPDVPDFSDLTEDLYRNLISDHLDILALCVAMLLASVDDPSRMKTSKVLSAMTLDRLGYSPKKTAEEEVENLLSDVEGGRP